MKTGLYILFGPDRYSLQEELESIKRSVGGGITSGDIMVLDSRQITPAQLLNICNTVPFLAAKRFVIVEGLLERFETGKNASAKQGRKRDKSKSEKNEWLILRDYAINMPETTVLVLIDGNITAKNALLSALTSVATIKSFPLLKGRQLTDWIHSRIRKRKGNIAPNAVTVLVEYVGSNLGMLNSEIDKLLIYTAGRRIEADDVKSLVSYTNDTNIFNLVDAALQHQPAQAMLLLHRLFDEGTSPSHIIGLLARQVRLLILAKELARQGIASQEAQHRLGISDYPFRKTMQQARDYSREELDYFYHKLLDADLDIKTGKWKAIRNEKWEDELILDVLVSELCSLALSVSTHTRMLPG